MMRGAPAAEDKEKTLENWFEIIQKKLKVLITILKNKSKSMLVFNTQLQYKEQQNGTNWSYHCNMLSKKVLSY